MGWGGVSCEQSTPVNVSPECRARETTAWRLSLSLSHSHTYTHTPSLSGSAHKRFPEWRSEALLKSALRYFQYFLSCDPKSHRRFSTKLAHFHLVPIQGYLAPKNTPPPRTLLWAYA